MRILIFAWLVVFVACVLQITHAGETKRKKLVLVVPEKIRHIHHHHVKKIYIKSKPHYHHTSYEEGLHRGDSAGSFEDDDDVGAIKTKSHGHHKRHSGSRHEHKEESKKVVIHSEEIPDSSSWHEEKSIEVHHPFKYGDHATAASIISKLTSKSPKSSSESSEEEHRTIVFLDNDGSSMTESPRTRVKTIHHHHHHHDHGTKEKSPSQANINSEPSRPSTEQVESQQLEPIRPQNLESIHSEIFEPRPQNLEPRPQILETRPKVVESIRTQNLEPRPQALELVRQPSLESIGSQTVINPAIDRPLNNALERPPSRPFNSHNHINHESSRPPNHVNHEPSRPPNHLNHEPSRPLIHINHETSRPLIHTNHEPRRPPNHINQEPSRPHTYVQSAGKPPLRGKPVQGPSFVERRPKGNSTFIANLVPPPVNQQSFTKVVHGSTGYSHGQSAGPRPSTQTQRPGKPNTSPPKTITGPVPQNTPNRIAPSGNNGGKSSFFHHHTQPAHSWRKR